MTTRKVVVFYKGEGGKEAKQDYKYDASVFLLSHLEKLCSLFGITEDPQTFTLQFRCPEENDLSQERGAFTPGTYLDFEEEAEATKKLVDGVELNLRIVPAVRAAKAVDILRDAAQQQPLRLKEIMFEMRFELKVSSIVPFLSSRPS